MVIFFFLYPREFTGLIFKTRLQILLYNCSSKKEMNRNRMKPNSMRSKTITQSGSMKSKVVNIYNGKTKELKANKKLVVRKI